MKATASAVVFYIIFIKPADNNFNNYKRKGTL